MNPADEALLDTLLRSLNDTGRVEYRGEYGVEITTFLPLVGWLKREGLLADRTVVSYSGMAPYYFFLDPGEFAEKDAQRRWLPEADRYWPSNSTYTATRQRWHAPPDYRAHYAPRARRFARPTLFVQNKFTVEWENGPINYIPLSYLHRLLLDSRDRFQIVFSRPGAGRTGAGFSEDQDRFCDYPDLSLLRQFPEALILEDMAAQEGRPYNEVKLEVLAGAHLFFAVQGGSAHILAAFGDSLLAVIHRAGHELPHAYAHGAYKYLAPRPPRLIVAGTNAEIDAAVAAFRAVAPAAPVEARA